MKNGENPATKPTIVTNRRPIFPQDDIASNGPTVVHCILLRENVVIERGFIYPNRTCKWVGNVIGNQWVANMNKEIPEL